MGQQQLLLLVLGIVIVGLAVVVGIQAFGENQKKSNADALVNDGVRIASDAQAWALKPAAFGGGDGKFTGVKFTDLGYELADGTGKCATTQYENLNGCFDLDATALPVKITGVSYEGEDNTTPILNKVDIEVSGTRPDQIKTIVNSPADNSGGTTN